MQNPDVLFVSIAPFGGPGRPRRVDERHHVRRRRRRHPLVDRSRVVGPVTTTELEEAPPTT